MKLSIKHQLHEAGAVTLLIGSTSLAICSAYELLGGGGYINSIGIVTLISAGAFTSQLTSIALRAHSLNMKK